MSLSAKQKDFRIPIVEKIKSFSENEKKESKHYQQLLNLKMMKNLIAKYKRNKNNKMVRSISENPFSLKKGIKIVSNSSLT